MQPCGKRKEVSCGKLRSGGRETHSATRSSLRTRLDLAKVGDAVLDALRDLALGRSVAGADDGVVVEVASVVLVRLLCSENEPAQRESGLYRGEESGRGRRTYSEGGTSSFFFFLTMETILVKGPVSPIMTVMQRKERLKVSTVEGKERNGKEKTHYRREDANHRP